MRVATWNTEWAAPGSARGTRVSSLLSALDCEVLVITEGSAPLLPMGGEIIDAGNDWGYETESDRRKVLAWSRTPWRDVSRVENGAGLGRVVAGTTDTSLGVVRVIAVCIPWRDCHVRTGRGNAKQWAEHLECCAQIADLIHPLPTDLPTLVIGDFNQRVPRHGQPVKVAEALGHALAALTVHTAGDTSCGQLIDHIATSEHSVPIGIEVWPGNDQHGRLSDHAGVALDFNSLK